MVYFPGSTSNVSFICRSRKLTTLSETRMAKSVRRCWCCSIAADAGSVAVRRRACRCVDGGDQSREQHGGGGDIRRGAGRPSSDALRGRGGDGSRRSCAVLLRTATTSANSLHTGADLRAGTALQTAALPVRT